MNLYETKPEAEQAHLTQRAPLRIAEMLESNPIGMPEELRPGYARAIIDVLHQYDGLIEMSRMDALWLEVQVVFQWANKKEQD